MRLYPKKLTSIEDIEREKKLLRKQMAQMESEPMFSADGLMEGIKAAMPGKGKGGGGFLSSVLGMLPVANPLVETLVGLVQSRLNNAGAAKSIKKKEKEATVEEERPKKHIVKKVVIEIVTGYLKWKALELSYKGVRYIIRRQKERRTEDTRPL